MHLAVHGLNDPIAAVSKIAENYQSVRAPSHFHDVPDIQFIAYQLVGTEERGVVS